MKTLLAAALLCFPIAVHALEQPVAPAAEKKICRSEQVTGSIFPKRVCHTKSEWVTVDEEQQRSAEQLQQRSRGNGVDVPH